MGSDNELKEEVVNIDDIVEHLAQKAINDGLDPQLMRESALQFFTDMYNAIGKGDEEAAKEGIKEIANKLEKRMLEIKENSR